MSISMTQHGLTTDILTMKLTPILISDTNKIFHHLAQNIFLINSFYDYAEFVTMTKLLREVQIK